MPSWIYTPLNKTSNIATWLENKHIFHVKYDQQQTNPCDVFFFQTPIVC